MENTIETSTLSCKVPEALKETLLSNLGDLTMLPAVATEAIAMTKNLDCEADDFSELVQKDVALASQILSVANCAIFSGGRPISSLQQAVIRLGYKQCRNLIVSSSTACLIKKMNLGDEWIREVLWQHSFTTATACCSLNRALELGFDGDEFTAGLLHDFGRLLFAVAANDEFQQADSLAFFENKSLLFEEEEILGTDHCRFGAWFAKEAGLPDELIEVIRHHHDTEADATHSRLVSLVIAADHLANHLQRKESISSYAPESNPGMTQLSRHVGVDLSHQFASVSDAVLLEVKEASTIA